MNTFQVGDRVLFGRDRGEKTLGVVVKINPKRLKVRTLEGRGANREGVEWSVPPALCVKAPADAQPREKVSPEVAETRDLTKTAKAFRVGERVWFANRSNQKVTGTVKRVNSKTVSVTPDGGGNYWRVPPSMLRREGETVTVPVKPKLTEEEIIARLASIECGLSPENLTCDGELPPSVWRRKAAQLNRERRELIAQLGREPTCDEIWGS